jgi:hypothetical protein
MMVLNPSQGVPVPASAAFIVIGTVAMGCSFVLAIIHAAIRAADRKRQLRLIEDMLRRGDLAPEVQRDLAKVLEPKPKRTMFALGWLGTVGGIGWLCTKPNGDAYTTAVVLTVVSFALVTLPFALRELEARRA